MIHLGVSVTFVQLDTVAGVFLLFQISRILVLYRDSWSGVVSLAGSLTCLCFSGCSGASGRVLPSVIGRS